MVYVISATALEKGLVFASKVEEILTHCDWATPPPEKCRNACVVYQEICIKVLRIEMPMHAGHW
jgi:hypothetical protein